MCGYLIKPVDMSDECKKKIQDETLAKIMGGVIYGKRCPNCGGHWNLRWLPRSSTAEPRGFVCKWCDYVGSESELKDFKHSSENVGG